MGSKLEKTPTSSIQSNPPSGQDADYSPKTYTRREKVIFCIKLAVISGIILLLFWLID